MKEYELCQLPEESFLVTKDPLSKGATLNSRSKSSTY